MKGRRTPVAKRKRMVRRRRAVRKMPNEHAKIVETHEFAPLTANSAWYDYATSLARCERATQIARGFQEYKITKVEYIFWQNQDTYANSQAGLGVPQLVARIDKTGALEAFTTVDQLAQTGAKYRRFDDKNIVISYKPAALQYTRDVANATNPWSKPAISPWLTTNKNNNAPGVAWLPSSIDHLGLAWYVEQFVAPGVEQPLYFVRQRIHFEFRKPLPVTGFVEGGVSAKQAPSINSPEAEQA